MVRVGTAGRIVMPHGVREIRPAARVPFVDVQRKNTRGAQGIVCGQAIDIRDDQGISPARVKGYGAARPVRPAADARHSGRTAKIHMQGFSPPPSDYARQRGRVRTDNNKTATE